MKVLFIYNGSVVLTIDNASPDHGLPNTGDYVTIGDFSYSRDFVVDFRTWFYSSNNLTGCQVVVEIHLK